MLDSDVRVHALASGSSGNAILVQAGRSNLLIDAGLPLRTLAPILSRRGVSKLEGILLTHEHSDHCAGAGPLARRMRTPIIANAPTLAAYTAREELPFPTCELPQNGILGLGTVGVRSFPIPHDAVAPVGFVLEIGKTQITYFTDAGCTTPEIHEALRGASLAIVEANHDVEWLWRGAYTDAMKARVASDTGHLSNGECADLLAQRLEEGGSLCVWLAHLSRVNNSPSLARRTIMARLARQTRVPFVLEVALRDHPSVTWREGTHAVQLALL